ncbi:signal recognition particle, SRP19 subunit [Aureobasidium sp. EXF-3400]|nr:signal recognition particle, SRP19 subunit [Aureobasidium sp. EXF-12344]KAI4783933.1 signal recognition particle, SRP19 subunit [Aureobasidium sp. EXF-3400]
MSRHARIEEVSDSDSDPSEMDPSEFDPGLLNSIIQPANIPSTAPEYPQQQQPMLQPHFPGRPPPDQNAERERTKHYQCLYPIYFDSLRSRAEGRRVGKNEAVANPLAQDIANACSQLPVAGQVVFEPAKTHPKDWANPGRVRVLIKEDGKPAGKGSIKNKHQLYKLVAEYLRAHPTTEESPMRMRIAGLPPPTKPVPPPAAPKGWKMGTILPLHSPALSGGGVNENYFKDMMQEMQGMQGQPGMPSLAGMESMFGGGGGGPSAPELPAPKKKDKKKSKA